MAKIGSWAYEGKMKVYRSLDKAHREEVEEVEVEEYDPNTGLFSDETMDPLDDPYFVQWTEAGPF